MCFIFIYNPTKSEKWLMAELVQTDNPSWHLSWSHLLSHRWGNEETDVSNVTQLGDTANYIQDTTF